ncbi:60S ribosomal protein L18a-1 [Apostasia shenzhenica]|uniref:60S ribosomal protein L18a-1 n=1 Tax=Apostasia shenzhenica TaxID=1088818 RepID=A0A2I0B0B7_9ASPA|nr:60S ribosomal protein L18a-1 [Apostasia shenzhenica]
MRRERERRGGEEERRKRKKEEEEEMSSEGEGRSSEAAREDGAFPKSSGDGFPEPARPPSVAGTYPPGASAVYPTPPPPAAGTAASAVPPPVQAPYPVAAPFYAYQSYPGAAVVAQGESSGMPRLPCFGLGAGWFLFIIGFFLAAIPWYAGAFILSCAKIDYREKPGFIACTIAVSFGF